MNRVGFPQAISIPRMPTLSSDRVNYLVWRYFKEEGLALSAYSLDKEAQTSNLDAEYAKEVAEGSLVRLLLKGLQMVELENAAGHIDSLNQTQLLDSSKEPEGSPDSAHLSKSVGAPRHVLTDDPIEPPLAENIPYDTQRLSVVNSGVNCKISGLERVDPPQDLKLQGGIDSTFNSPSAFVVAGTDTVTAYISQDTTLREVVLDCNEKPTCVEPLGMSFDGANQSLLVGYASGVVRQWGLGEQGSVLQSVFSNNRGSTSPILLVKSSPSGLRAAAANVSAVGLVDVWDLQQRSLLCQLVVLSSQKKDSNLVGDIAWVNSNSTVAVSYASGIAIYRVPEEPTSESIMPITWLAGHKKPVAHLSFELATQLLASGGDDGRVCLWDAQSTEPIRQLVASQISAPISHTSWLGVHLLTSSTEGAISYWDIRSSDRALIASIDVGEPVYSLRVSKHITTHIAAVVSSGVKVYKLDLQQPHFEFVGEVLLPDIECVSWGSDQSFVVSSPKESILLRCPM